MFFLFSGIPCNMWDSTSEKRGRKSRLSNLNRFSLHIFFYQWYSFPFSLFTGDVRELYKYESERQKHNMATMASIDGLYRLYSTTATPIVLLRSLGLSAVNTLSPLKVRLRETSWLYSLLGLLTGRWLMASIILIVDWLLTLQNQDLSGDVRSADARCNPHKLVYLPRHTMNTHPTPNFLPVCPCCYDNSLHTITLVLVCFYFKHANKIHCDYVTSFSLCRYQKTIDEDKI